MFMERPPPLCVDDVGSPILGVTTLVGGAGAWLRGAGGSPMPTPGTLGLGGLTEGGPTAVLVLAGSASGAERGLGPPDNESKLPPFGVAKENPELGLGAVAASEGAPLLCPRPRPSIEEPCEGIAVEGSPVVPLEAWLKRGVDNKPPD